LEQDGEEEEASGDELDGIFDESGDEGTVPFIVLLLYSRYRS